LPLGSLAVEMSGLRTTLIVALVCLAAGAGIGLLLLAPHRGRQPHAPPPPPPPTVVNSPNCKPPPQHPDPVLLVPGTFEATSWATLAPALAQRGYCVFTVSYGNEATGDIVNSAHQLAGIVDRVLERTGAHEVAIVGHSQGGLMPRYYIKYLGGAKKVSALVALSPSNHGTENLMALVGEINGCTACGQQLAWGSAFLDRLNAGDQAPGPTAYTVIQTQYDQVVQPYSSAFLRGPASRVTNVLLQDRCPGDMAGHLDITADPVAAQWVENALGRDGPADPAFVPVC
jgi:triacylglycerol lipase